MAIATEQIVTQYVADASAHLRAVSQIVDAQGKLTKSVEATTDAQQKSSSSATEFLSKFTIGLGTASAAYATFKGGFSELLQSQRLAAAAGTVDIGQLDKASAGLIDRMTLMRLAAAGQTGAFRLTQAQMETAAGAIRALTRDGNDQAKVIDKVMEAITKGTAGGLDDFGIIVDTTSSKVGDFNAMMGALEAQSKRVSGVQRTTAEDIAATGVSFENSMSKVKQSIGEIVIALAPLIEAVGSLVDTAAGWITNMTDFGSGVSAWFDNPNGLNQIGSKMYTWARKNDTGYDEALAANQTGGKSRVMWESQMAINQAIAEKLAADSAAQAAMFKGTAFGDISLAGQFGAASPTISFAAKPSQRRGGSGGSDNSLTRTVDDPFFLQQQQYALRGVGDIFMPGSPSGVGQNPGSDLDGAGYQDFLNAKGNAKLKGIFGPIEDFDKYAKAFGMLEGAVGAAMTAWIDGTGNAGEAIRHFIADSLKSYAIEMAMQALRHGAYAIGSLAMGNVAGAAAHGKSAAMFAAGAVAAGVAANQLGTSAGDSARPSAGGASAGAPSTISSGQSPTGTVYIYGDSFADDSPRMRQRRAERAFATANNGNQGSRGV